jgi:hypothetical protein
LAWPGARGWRGSSASMPRMRGPDPRRSWARVWARARGLVADRGRHVGRRDASEAARPLRCFGAERGKGGEALGAGARAGGGGGGAGCGVAGGERRES